MGYSPWGHKELDMTEQLSLFHILVLGYAGLYQDLNCHMSLRIFAPEATLERPVDYVSISLVDSFISRS